MLIYSKRKSQGRFIKLLEIKMPSLFELKHFCQCAAIPPCPFTTSPDENLWCFFKTFFSRSRLSSCLKANFCLCFHGCLSFPARLAFLDSPNFYCFFPMLFFYTLSKFGQICLVSCHSCLVRLRLLLGDNVRNQVVGKHLYCFSLQ